MTYNHNLKIDSNDISFSSAYERDYMLVSDDENNVIAIDITSDEVKDKMIGILETIKERPTNELQKTTSNAERTRQRHINRETKNDSRRAI